MAQITNEKTVLFIDGSNFYAAARSLGMDIDYARMRAHFAKDARLIRAYYYTALPEDQEYSPLRPLIDWLDYNGYAVVSKLTREFTDPDLLCQAAIRRLGQARKRLDRDRFFPYSRATLLAFKLT